MTRFPMPALAGILCLALAALSALAAPESASVVAQLRQGGLVLVMRHASSPSNPPDKQSADRQNVKLERQLDEKGRATASAMGKAFRAIGIAVGTVYSSPTYRARETVRLAGWGTPRLADELGDQGHSMARIQGAGPADWLRAKVREAPEPGGNTILVTHMPNIVAAFPALADGLEDGEAMVFRPAGKGEPKLVAKIPISEWPTLAKAK